MMFSDIYLQLIVEPKLRDNKFQFFLMFGNTIKANCITHEICNQCIYISVFFIIRNFKNYYNSLIGFENKNIYLLKWNKTIKIRTYYQLVKLNLITLFIWTFRLLKSIRYWNLYFLEKSGHSFGIQSNQCTGCCN